MTDLLKSLAQKAGVPTAEIDKLVALESIASVEVDDSTADLLERNLMNLDVAKTHPAIKDAIGKMIKAELYNGLDAEITSTMTEIGLTEAQQSEILAEKSSTKRAALLAKKVKEYEAANHKDAGTAEKRELIQKVNDLNNNISKLQSEHAAALQAKDTELASKLLNKEIEFDLLGFNYALPENTPAHVKLAAARAVIDSQLATKGLKVISDNGVRKVVKADNTDYFDEHNKPVSYNDFISGALAQNNLLAASNDDGNGGEGGKTKFPPRVDNDGKDKNKPNPSLIEAADSDLDNIKQYMTVQ